VAAHWARGSPQSRASPRTNIISLSFSSDCSLCLSRGSCSVFGAAEVHLRTRSAARVTCVHAAVGLLVWSALDVGCVRLDWRLLDTTPGWQVRGEGATWPLSLDIIVFSWTFFLTIFTAWISTSECAHGMSIIVRVPWPKSVSKLFIGAA